MTRDRSQMTLEAFEPAQQRLTDAEAAQELKDDLGTAPRDVDHLLRQMEAAA